MFIKRQIFDKIWKEVHSPDILLLNGPRQSGKTTLLQMIAEKLKTESNVPENRLLFFDLENVDHLNIWSNQAAAKSVLPLSDNQNKYFVFIDEFQKSKNIGSILKFIHDHHQNFKFLITGSASWYLNIDESMAGRKKVFEIWPLSFTEYMELPKLSEIKKYYQIIAANPDPSLNTLVQSVNQEWINFINFGGYPRVVLSDDKKEKIEILGELINSYLLRDIQIWNYAANPLQVKQLLTILASRIGSLLDISSLGANTGMGRSALINRLELLQNTFILFLTRPYFTNKIKELIKNPKIYLIDNGLRNSFLQNFSLMPQTTDFGMVAENSVICELLKNSDSLDQILFWRTKQGQEIDIVLKREKQLIPIEIKSGNETAVPSGLKSFINQYNPQTAYVLNWSEIKEVNHKGCRILFRPLWFPIK